MLNFVSLTYLPTYLPSVTPSELMLIIPVMLWSGLVCNAVASVIQVGKYLPTYLPIQSILVPTYLPTYLPIQSILLLPIHLSIHLLPSYPPTYLSIIIIIIIITHHRCRASHWCLSFPNHLCYRTLMVSK